MKNQTIVESLGCLGPRNSAARLVGMILFWLPVAAKILVCGLRLRLPVVAFQAPAPGQGKRNGIYRV